MPDHRKSIDATISAVTESFLSAFETDWEAQANAVTYLAVLAAEGSDKNFSNITQISGPRLSRFREEAHKAGLMKADGRVHQEIQNALVEFLSKDELYAGELSAVKKQCARLEPAPPAYSPPVQKTNAAAAALTTPTDLDQKISALREGDVPALTRLVAEGVKFSDTDLNSAVHYRDPKLRPEMTRLVCEGGATCPEWVRLYIKDPELLVIIDNFAKQNAGKISPQR